jgi:hypothetical protein
VVSEDSAYCRWPSIHRLDDPSDLKETAWIKVATLLHELEHFHELPEVLPFAGEQRVALEERDNDLVEISEPSHHVTVLRLSMIVLAAIHRDRPTAEVVADHLERACARGSLHHDELRLHLPAQRRLVIPLDWHAEATFTVDEADDPPSNAQSFLLIVRTRHIFTTVAATSDGIR